MINTKENKYKKIKINKIFSTPRNKNDKIKFNTKNILASLDL